MTSWKQQTTFQKIEQKAVNDKILGAVETGVQQKYFFLDVVGGNDKTSVLSCLLEHQRGRGQKPVINAFTDTAATLLQEDRAIHNKSDQTYCL
jgi:hypothetical protein